MLVSTENFTDVLSKPEIESSLDTETTGLMWQKRDRLFSIIYSTTHDNYYFNFIDYPESPKALPDAVKESLRTMCSDEHRIWFLQNAKFDLHMLAREGIFIRGKIYDLMFLERIFFNQHMSYRLTDITKRWGDEKLDTVWEYIKKNKLITKIEHERLGKTEERPHFDQVPFDMIYEYGQQDGAATLNVGRKILESIRLEDSQIIGNQPTQMQVVENEAKLVHTLFKMEEIGVQLDLDYCNKALDHYLGVIKNVEIKFKELTGLDFVKGTTVFEEVFVSEKDKWEKTEKGNWKWDAAILENFENPAAQIAIDYAEAKKQSEYFANFLYYCDESGTLHPDFQQSGTVTGRLSCRDPNLQNLTNPDKYDGETEASLFPIRKAFVPREGFFFVMIDYSQSEFRLALEYAKAHPLIREVLKGHDVHTATAQLAGVSRKEAKTVNFLSIYGGGVVKLAQNLNKGKLKGSRAQLGAIYKKMFGWRLSDDEKAAWPSVTDELRKHNEPFIQSAYDIQQSIFRAVPELKDFLKQVQKVAESRGYVRNWLGRRYQFPDKRWAYKAPNHLIQGSAAEIIKIAMNRVDEYLQNKESRMLLTIHDELIFEIKCGEEYVVSELKKIMEGAYSHKFLPQIAEVSWNPSNLSEKMVWSQ